VARQAKLKIKAVGAMFCMLRTEWKSGNESNDAAVRLSHQRHQKPACFPAPIEMPLAEKYIAT
jgi:hypothetical protein